MSDIINQAYDEMELDEVICRLPSKFAIGSVKRRIDNIDKFKKLFKARDIKGAGKVKEVRNHINDIISATKINDIFDTLEPKYHPALFGWLDGKNKTRLLKDGRDKLTVEFMFNITKSDDLEGLTYILNKILTADKLQVSKVTSVLSKINKEHFSSLVNIVIKDSRPNVKSSILSITNDSNFKMLGDHQKMVALKAFAKIPSSRAGSNYIRSVNFKLFQSLKPLERIMALDRYLSYFPTYNKLKVFNPEPTKEEFDSVLFAGCFEYNDIVEGIVKKYNQITKDERPKNP